MVSVDPVWLANSCSLSHEVVCVFVCACGPLKKCCHIQRVPRYIEHRAFWTGSSYSIWRLPEAVVHSRITGAWCSDVEVLQEVYDRAR